MWDSLDIKKKYLVLIGAMIFVFYMCYVFSFRGTLAAINLNKKLKTELIEVDKLGGDMQIVRKNNYYSTAVKLYKLRKEDWENRLWNTVSGMALANNVSIGFVPNPVNLSDTLVVNGLAMQQFSFKGNYFNLVKLLDTMSKTSGARIADLKLFNTKEEKGDADKLNMHITLVALLND
jgi:hypothetical protein